jgi:hypothetical protein
MTFEPSLPLELPKVFTYNKQEELQNIASSKKREIEFHVLGYHKEPTVEMRARRKAEKTPGQFVRQQLSLVTF